jgi:hypothetical protein
MLQAETHTTGIVTQALTVSNDGGSPLRWSLGNQSAEAPTGGELKSFFSMTSTDERYPIAGVAYDGTVLWTCKGQSSSMLHKLDAVTGETVGTLDVGAVCSMPTDIAWGDSELWLCDYLYAKLHAVDPVTGQALRTFVLPDHPSQIAFGDGALWVCDIWGTVSRLDPDTGSVLSSFTCPGSGNLAYFRDALWMNGSDNRILKVNPENGDVLSSFSAVPSGWSGPWHVAGSDNSTALFVVYQVINLWGPSYACVGLMETDELPWLREAPWGGTVPAYSSATVRVTFDAAFTTAGVHSADIEIRANDLETPSMTIPVTFTVTNAANRPPVAGRDVIRTPKDTAVVANVLANDWDTDNDPLIVTDVRAPFHGMADYTASNVTYTPMPGYTGLDVFWYTAADGRGGVVSGKVGVVVTPWTAQLRLTAPSEDDVGLSWDAEPGWLYTVEYRANLLGTEGWSPLVSSISGAGTGTSRVVWTDVVTNRAPVRFYRIRADLL